MRLTRALGRDRSRPLKLAWVTADLAIGAAPVGTQWRQVADAGIEAVADLRAEVTADERPAETHGLSYASFPIGDGEAASYAELRRAAGWILSRIERARPVLIHCREGRGRSVLVACVTLRELGFSTTDAYALVRRAQPAATLSDDQLRALEAYAPAKA